MEIKLLVWCFMCNISAAHPGYADFICNLKCATHEECKFLFEGILKMNQFSQVVEIIEFSSTHAVFGSMLKIQEGVHY